MKISAVIIDDEQDVRYVLKSLIERFLSDKVDIVGEEDDVKSGVQLIQETNPELVFLDVKLKQGTGFDLLEHFEDQNFEVIFVTAYDNFAIQAFQFSALGYLLKPLKSNELLSTFNKVNKRISIKSLETKSRLKVLVNNFNNSNSLQLCIGNVEGFTVLELSDIMRLESENNYTHFYTANDKKYTSSKTLKEYEELLSEHGFYRIHQSHLINLRFIKAYQKRDGGNVILTNMQELPLARQRKSGFLKRFL